MWSTVAGIIAMKTLDLILASQIMSMTMYTNVILSNTYSNSVTVTMKD